MPRGIAKQSQWNCRMPIILPWFLSVKDRGKGLSQGFQAFEEELIEKLSTVAIATAWLPLLLWNKGSPLH